jgi:serine/threonine protein kinase
MGAFDNLATDRVTVEKLDGTTTGPFKATVTASKVVIFDSSADVVEGDVVCRPLPNGRTERYIVTESVFYQGTPGIPPNFQLKVRREPPKKKQDQADAQERASRFLTMSATYRRTDTIGEGATGVVYRVEDDNGDEFALKHLKKGAVSTERVKRFRNEIWFCSRTEHPNLIRVLDWGYTDDDDTRRPFVVTPLFDCTLRLLMDSGIEHRQVLRLYSMILDGVEAAHLLEVWHRDLKPENILCQIDGSNLVVADWGIAHFAEPHLLTLIETRQRSRMANFRYAAPEQRDPRSHVDKRADIFALGLILNEMFTGEVPQGSGYRLIEGTAEDLSYLDSVVDKMIRQDPSERPQDISEVKRLLVAAGNEYVQQQELSALKRRVIPTTEPDDPLIETPVEVVATDYRDGKLIFTLSQPVNQLWIDAFGKDVTSYTSGYGPRDFQISRDRIAVKADERQVNFAVRHLRQYLDRAREWYPRLVERQLRRRDQEERARLQEEVAAEERRLRILQSIDL